MLIQEPDGRWFVASELGPESTAERREVTHAEAMRILNEMRAREAARLDAIERAEFPEYVI